MERLPQCEVTRRKIDVNDEILQILGRDCGEIAEMVPSVVVVGIQSAGKSSVIEMLSGIQLPSGEGCITHRPLMIQLRRATVREGRPPPPRTITFTPTFGAAPVTLRLDEVAAAVAAETKRTDAEQRSKGNPSGIVDQPMILRVECPTLPSVTLIDLPGLNFENGETQIQKLVRDRIKGEQAIVLVVHRAIDEFANTQTSRFVTEADPHGSRSLAVLTFMDCCKEQHYPRVKAWLTDPSDGCFQKFAAMRGYVPGDTFATDVVRHVQLESKEKIFFQEHPVFGPLKEQGCCLGTERVLGLVADKYLRAVIAAEAPLGDALFRARAKAQAELERLPHKLDAAEMFREAWAETIDELRYVLSAGQPNAFTAVEASSKGGRVWTDRDAQEPLHMRIRKLCVDEAKKLRTVPVSIVKGGGASSGPGFAEIARSVKAEGLPDVSDFNHYLVIQQFAQYHIEKHFGTSSTEVLAQMTCFLDKIHREIMLRLRAPQGKSAHENMKARCWAIVDAEFQDVRQRTLTNLRERVENIVQARFHRDARSDQAPPLAAMCASF